MTDVVESLGAVTVHIRDIKRARPFYKDVLGLKEIDYNEEAERARYAIPGSTTFLVVHKPGPDEGGREPGTVSGLAFFHRDPHAAIAEIRRRGGTVTVEPVMIQPPGIAASYAYSVIADPDGNEFILRAPPPAPK